jgi:hypothetical protein
MLACPACPRTWFSEKFNRPFPKFDLDNRALSQFLMCDAGKKINHFLLEGNHGDSIYYPKLFEFMDYWRASKSFTIVTAGSNRSEQWWRDFSSKLTDKDVIIFSIDGDASTNHLYRTNSDWTSVINGLKIAAQSPAKVVWRTILFKTNEHQIDALKQLAEQYGADEFVLELTHRFGDDEKFKPNKFVDFDVELADNISAKCKDYKMLYISAEGYIAPCCWAVSYFTLHQTEFWKEKEKWSMNNTTLDQFINEESLITFIKKTEDNYNSAYSVCKQNCNINIKDIKHYEQRILSRTTKTVS